MDMLRPKALDHVGLKVTGMEKSLHFYQTLGLELLRDIRSEGRGACGTT
jgi:catechol 2,3-dioxygenase-like lactoylglutathione lyase family enzyme